MQKQLWSFATSFCEVCDVAASFFLNFLWQATRNFMLICTDVPFSCSTYESTMHTRTDKQDRHTHTHTHAHTHTSHTFILLCKFACSCDSPAPKEAARFCHTQQGMDTEGVGGSVKKSETMLHLGTTPASLCHPLFPLVTPRLEFILIFSSSWQRFYLHCFNLYLFCTLKITLSKG